MNALIDKYPTSIEINGELYEINSDFRTCLTIIMAFEDVELSPLEKQTIMLELLYKQIPDDTAAACDMALKFLNCGEESSTVYTEPPERLYHFEKDSKYIYSAIKQTHGVDLESVEHLHWWAFNFMFLDLREDCFFSKILYYRQQRKKGKLTPEEQEYCDKISEILELPENLTEEEKTTESEFMRLLGC